MISGIIHQVVIEAMEANGYHPYLYFADGVVYLGPTTTLPQLDRIQITEAVWQHIATRMRVSGYGFKRDGKGLRIAPPLFELLSLADIIQGANKNANDISNNKASNRLQSMGKGDLGLQTDLRVDRLAEFLAIVQRQIARACVSGHRVKLPTGLLIGWNCVRPSLTRRRSPTMVMYSGMVLCRSALRVSA